MNNNRTVTR